MQELSKAKDPDLINSLVAMKRAAKLAREVAIQTGTSIVLVKEGKIVYVSARELLDKNKV